MQINNKSSQNNYLALGIGFLLIVVIVVFSLWQSEPEKKSTGENTKEIASQEVEVFDSISVKDLQKKIMSFSKKIIILDIRSRKEFENEHILDSINIPFPEFERNAHLLEKGKEYVLVDILGGTSAEKMVLKFLEENGIEASYLEGGITAWKNADQITIALGNPYVFSDQAKVSYIKPEELDKILKSDEIYILDLRKNADFKKEHIPGAKNLPFSSLEEKRRDIPVWKKVILYGETNVESFQGAVKLFDMGILNVFTLTEGFSIWKEKGYAVSALE